MQELYPINQVILELDKPFEDEIITKGGLHLYLDSSFRKSYNVTTKAKIAHLPVNPDPKFKKIIAQLQVGDEVAINYLVCGDVTYRGDEGQFMSSIEAKDERMQEYRNGKGERIHIYAFQKRKGFGDVWAGVYLDKRGQYIDGCQGSEEDVSRWKSQFSFGKTDIYFHNNLFEYKGKTYWKCSPDEIYAKRIKGHLVAIGNRVIMQPVEEQVPLDVKHYIASLTDDVKIQYQDRGSVLTGGKSRGFKRNDVVSFESKFLEKYSFFGKNYFVVNENLVIGKWN